MLLFAIVGATGCYVLGVYPVLAAQRSLLIGNSRSLLRGFALMILSSIYCSTTYSASAFCRVPHLGSGSDPADPGEPRLGIRILHHLLFHPHSGRRGQGSAATKPDTVSSLRGPSCRVVLKKRRRHPWHLNERFLYLITGSFLLSLCLSIQDSLTGTTVMEWPRRKVCANCPPEDLMLNLPGTAVPARATVDLECHSRIGRLGPSDPITFRQGGRRMVHRTVYRLQCNTSETLAMADPEHWFFRTVSLRQSFASSRLRLTASDHSP